LSFRSPSAFHPHPARIIQAAGIDFASLPEEPADDLLGAYTGAGTIFGVTGGGDQPTGANDELDGLFRMAAWLPPS
jgi:hypothetical protein